MADGERTLVRLLADGQDPSSTDARPDHSVTAIWGSGPNNSLVVVLEAIFTWRLEHVAD